MLIVCCFGCIASISENPADIGVSIGIMVFFIICCIVIGAIFIAGAVSCILIRRYNIKVKKYLTVIVGERKLEAIAAAVGKDYDVAKINVRKIIEKGYLKNAYLNENTGEVIFSIPAKQVEQKMNASTEGNANERVVACHCCGANNTVFGAVGECDFCGALLK